MDSLFTPLLKNSLLVSAQYERLWAVKAASFSSPGPTSPSLSQIFWNWLHFEVWRREEKEEVRKMLMLPVRWKQDLPFKLYGCEYLILAHYLHFEPMSSPVSHNMQGLLCWYMDQFVCMGEIDNEYKWEWFGLKALTSFFPRNSASAKQSLILKRAERNRFPQHQLVTSGMWDGRGSRENGK